MTAKKPARQYVRTTTQEPERQPMSLGRLTTILGSAGLALAFFPAWWSFSGHWMNRSEIEDATKKVAVDAKADKDKVAADAKAAEDKQMAALKAHQDHDSGVQMWNQFGFADTRRQFLEDHKFECDTMKMMAPKLTPMNVAICQHYESAYTLKVQEANALKDKAMDSTKEKP